MTLRPLATTSLIALLAVGMLATSGCNLRGAKPAPKEVDPETESLKARNAELESQLAQARDELAKGGSGTIAEDISAIQGGPIEGFEPTARGGVALPDDFAFAKGSADLNDDGQKAIARLAQRLNEAGNADKQIIVEGHTDHSPVARAVTKDKFTDNWGLSAARSAAVTRALEKAGVNPQRLHGAFRGEHTPRVAISADKQNDASGEAANRRVEIFLK